MKIERRKFRIGELANRLNVERFVIRFWEKEFGVKTDRSEGSQRFYDEQALKMFTAIKSLLYEEGYTIAGAKKQLKCLSPKKAPITASLKTSFSAPEKTKTEVATPSKQEDKDSIAKQIEDLKKQLYKLKELL